MAFCFYAVILIPSYRGVGCIAGAIYRPGWHPTWRREFNPLVKIEELKLRFTAKEKRK